MKTATLISFACQAGTIIGNAAKELTEKLAAFGTYLGLTFQLTDDLLDVTASTKVLGKTARKDETGHKATFVRLQGIEETKKSETNSSLKQKHF
ncbi:geranyltranstransferase [Bartonella henselae]|uniref:Geranyltranstransferase n=1 Tax=Bartonella henselae TaxID=38323 RepID=X5MGS7_BARHN|nr:geranyltranstransferase [Bartonella henselae]